jgi:hypothetical protein
MSGKMIKLEDCPMYSRVKVDTGVLVRNRAVYGFNFLFVENDKAECVTEEGTSFTLDSELSVEFICSMKDYEKSINGNETSSLTTLDYS